MKQLFQTLMFLIPVLLTACRQEYTPQVKSSDAAILVVEGFLNSSGGPTTIRLSRSFTLNDSVRQRTESGAQVRIENKAGDAFFLYEQTPGTYTADQTTLDAAEQYRLHIITGDGREYASDFVPVLQNPPIDSISWKRDNAGVTIFVNTHNPENNTRYYRWEYEETWEFHSAFYSAYKFLDDQVVARQLPEEQIYACWRFYNSSNLILGSTAQLASDVVSEKRLIQIPKATEKLSVRYSVLVRQYALDKRGYEFYQLLRKNTESLGSLFDAQPTQIGGNVHALSDSSERVIGYITAAPVWEKRLFISNSDVPDWKFTNICSSIEVPNNTNDIKSNFGSGTFVPYAPHGDGRSIVGWYAALPECVDCRTRGGITQKPFYW